MFGVLVFWVWVFDIGICYRCVLFVASIRCDLLIVLLIYLFKCVVIVLVARTSILFRLVLLNLCSVVIVDCLNCFVFVC